MTLSASVVICTHDRPEALRRAAESVLAQTRPPAELIVVSDGPGDLDPHLAERAGRAGVRFVSARQDRPSLPASRNRGMGLARGDVVLLLDDDMTCPPDFLAELLSLYEADPRAVVAGIGAVPSAPPLAWPDRLWRAAAEALGAGRWFPRRCRSRSVPLPEPLRERLVPARRLSGGAISLRGPVAAVERFDEALGGYALGEDREFCYRVGARRALFECPGLRLTHDEGFPGRPAMSRLGRMYVHNSLRIASAAVGGGAGTWLLAGCELAGAALLHLLYLPLGDRRGHAGFLAGMAAAGARAAADAARRCLCGC